MIRIVSSPSRAPKIFLITAFWIPEHFVDKDRPEEVEMSTIALI
jgi:hypothetical protein